MKTRFLKRLTLAVLISCIVVGGFNMLAFAAEEGTHAKTSGIDTLWVLIAAFLVFIMQAGFGMLEAGLIRTKNTCNVLMNNFLDFCMASMGFFIFGYAIMFGKGNGFMGFNGWCLFNATHEGTIPLEASWLFHAVFCGAAATIVAGGIAAKMIVLLDELASLDLQPGRTAAELNRALAKIAPKDGVMFATGLHFRFERNLQRVTCCSFGHDGPIFSRTGPIQIESGFPVGLTEENKPWPEKDLDLTEHGKRFLVFSDGITEQFNANGELFGINGLHEAFRKHIDLPLDEMVSRIVKNLTRFRGTALVKDDQTLLALDFVG